MYRQFFKILIFQFPLGLTTQLLSFKGRANRMQFFVYLVGMFVALSALHDWLRKNTSVQVAQLLEVTPEKANYYIKETIICWVLLGLVSICFRRQHDFGRGGIKAFVISILPLAVHLFQQHGPFVLEDNVIFWPMCIVVFMCGFPRGNPCDNAYGKDTTIFKGDINNQGGQQGNTTYTYYVASQDSQMAFFRQFKHFRSMFTSAEEVHRYDQAYYEYYVRTRGRFDPNNFPGVDEFSSFYRFYLNMDNENFFGQEGGNYSSGSTNDSWYEQSSYYDNSSSSTNQTTEDDIDEAYKTLEIDKGASFSEIKKQYRRMSAKYHPDKYPNFASLSEDEQQKINEASATINNAFAIIKKHLGEK